MATYAFIHGAGDGGWYWHLVAAMVPAPGETGAEWCENTGYERAVREAGAPDDEIELFLHDVPPELATEALARARAQAGRPMAEPWPLDAWRAVPTRYLLCRRDRLFPAEWLRRVVRERLGFEPDEIDAAHTPALSRPAELAERLEAYRDAL
jgi:hypothetical protein